MPTYHCHMFGNSWSETLGCIHCRTFGYVTTEESDQIGRVMRLAVAQRGHAEALRRIQSISRSVDPKGKERAAFVLSAARMRLDRAMADLTPTDRLELEKTQLQMQAAIPGPA